MKLNIDDVLEKIRVYIAINHEGKQKGLADELGVSRTFISYVMTKRKPPSRELLSLVGVSVERKSVYEYRQEDK